jgi:putative membrane protein
LSVRLLFSHWHISPGLTAMVALYAAAYLRTAARSRSRWPRRRTVSFMGGLLSIVVALESGIAGYDDRLLSVHMVQHMILLMLAPLLLLAGQPALLTVKGIRTPSRRRALVGVLRRTSRVLGPLPCLAVFSAVVLLTHLPSFYDAALRHPLVHDSEHALYLLAGLLLWWPVLDVDPAPARRLGGLGRLVYMLAAMPAMALVGAYLNRHPTLVYAGYGPPAHVLGVSPITDQAQAGAIMWVAGTMMMTAFGLWVAVSALLAEERRQRARDERLIGTGGLS